MDSETVTAYVDAAAAALELPILPEHRPGVLMYFQLAASMAALVAGQPLRIEDEPAAVFRPIETHDMIGGGDKTRIR
jgi:hypothetical protein